MVPERLSIELSNRCAKACAFCYSKSGHEGTTLWTPDELVAFVTDCAMHGAKAVSFGGGEPLEYAGLFEVLRRLEGVVFRSFTTNGLLLDRALPDVVAARPDKVHVSIHFPDREAEVERVIRQVGELAAAGLKSGVNLLVRKSQLTDAWRAASQLRAAGIGNERIVYLPMRGDVSQTPSPAHLAAIAEGPFQSMTCIAECGKSNGSAPSPSTGGLAGAATRRRSARCRRWMRRD